MTRNIYLKGRMGKLFGEVWRLNAATVKEAMNGIDVQREGKLKQYLIECTEKGIEFSVQRGEDYLDYDNLQMNLGEDDIIITPLPQGAGKTSSRLKAIVGVALMIVGFLMPGDAGTKAKLIKLGVMLLGSVLATQGITELMTPKSPSKSRDGYLFNGPENTVKQGIPVPLCYGELIVGGAPVNFGFIGDTTRPSGYTFVGKSGGSVPNSDDPVGRFCFVSGSVGDSGQDSKSRDGRADSGIGSDNGAHIQ